MFHKKQFVINDKYYILNNGHNVKKPRRTEKETKSMHMKHWSDIYFSSLRATEELLLTNAYETCLKQHQ